MRQFEQYAGALTPQQRSGDRRLAAAAEGAGPGRRPAAGSSPAAGGMGVGVEVVDVMRTDNRRGSLVSFYAAGIGVMFLLFSSVAGAGGALLDEVESGTLERLLSTRIGMTGLLAGKWLLLALIGLAQLTVMFLWGTVAFGLPLFSHLPGFVVMTAVTASAAAALGLVLATLARTRAQLSGFSTILILTMSALGGSMFPRFLMSENDAEARAADVQRLGARRLPEGVLARGAGVAALAAGAGARRVDRGVPRRRPDARATVGGGVGAGRRSQVSVSGLGVFGLGFSLSPPETARPETETP